MAYDTKALLDAAYRGTRPRPAQKERQSRRWMRGAGQWLRQVACRHAKTSDIWLRSHPEYVWIIGHRCLRCGHRAIQYPPHMIRRRESQGEE